jgi:hypothetical protein
MARHKALSGSNKPKDSLTYIRLVFRHYNTVKYGALAGASLEERKTLGYK